MEIVRKHVHMTRRKDQAVSQITLESDFNVPDIKPDIDKLILDQSEIQMDDVRPEKDRIILKGVLLAELLYASSQAAAKIQGMECRIPFEEMIHMEGLEAGDSLKIDWDIEDLNVSAIHSRKVSIRSIVTFTVVSEELYDEELAQQFRTEEAVETCTEEVELLCLAMNRKDTFRIREEVLLANNQANIQELLWKDISTQGLEMRLMEGKLSIKGELAVFALYEGENEEQIQWVSQVLPFAGMIDLSGCKPEMISDIQIHMIQKNMEVKPDYDGEERMFQIEAVLGLDIRLYEEVQTELMKDAYSLNRDLHLIREEAKLDRLLLKNYSKVRYSERISVKRDDLPVLQICYTSGKVVIEEIRKTAEGLMVEGIILVQVLYITSNDRIPVCRTKGGIPFTHRLEVPELDERCTYSLKGELENISAAMMDSQDAEIRASVNFHLLVHKPQICQNIQSVETEPLDYEKLHMLPGIVGCMVGEDDSLWHIAKKYYTTVANICRINQVTEKQVKPGDKLLVIKSIERV